MATWEEAMFCEMLVSAFGYTDRIIFAFFGVTERF
jgi:hypothetical protein